MKAMGSKTLYELTNNSVYHFNHHRNDNDSTHQHQHHLTGVNIRNDNESNSHVHLPVIIPNDTQLCPLYAQVVYLSDESDIENSSHQPRHSIDSPVTVNISPDESDDDDDDSSTEIVYTTATNKTTKITSNGNCYNNYKYTDPEDDDNVNNDGVDTDYYKGNSSTMSNNNQQQNPKCRVTPIEMDYLNHHPLPPYLETIVEVDEEDYISSSSSSTFTSDDDQVTISPPPVSSTIKETSKSYQIHNQSEEEILSPGEEGDTIDGHSHHHLHQQHQQSQHHQLLSAGHHHHHHHPHIHQPHHHHHHHSETALISCPGTTIIFPPRPPDRPRILSEIRSDQLSQSTGLICDHHLHNLNNNNNQNNSESDIIGIGEGARGQEGDPEGRLIDLQIGGEEGKIVVENEREEDTEDSNHLPPEIPPLPPSPLHHQLHHHHHHIHHHQLYQNNFSGFPSLEALEDHHRQHHHNNHHRQQHHQQLQHQYQSQHQHQDQHQPNNLHYPFLHHFHLPLQRSSTIESPSGGSDFQLPCSPESEDLSDMTSVIKGPSYRARAPKNIWSPGSTTTSSSSDLASTPAALTPGPMTMASATQTTPTRSESLNLIKCNTLPHGFRPVKLTQVNDNNNDLIDGKSRVTMMVPTSSTTTASSPGSGGALVASSLVCTGDDNSFTVMPSSPSETTSVRQPESLVSPTASQSGVTQVTSSQPINQPRTPSEQGETSSDVPSAPGQLPTPPTTSLPLKDETKYWTLPRQSSSSSTAGIAGSYHQEPFLSSSSDYPNDPNISSVVTDKAPPRNAKFLYETPTAKYYTLPTTQTEIRSTIVPPPPKYDGIGPVNETGVPLGLRSGVKDEYGSDWYKSMYKRLHRCDRPRSELDQPIRVKLKSSRNRDRMDPDYFSEDENTSRIPPRNIADYEPGRSSISLREKHKFYADLINYIDTIFSEVFSSNVQDSSSETNEDLVNRVINANQTHHHRPKSLEDTHRRHTISKRDLNHKDCVFNALTSPNGYESDSSYVIKKKEPRSAPSPASRSTYCAVQRGDMDIPFSGLQKPAPAPRAHKESPHRFDEGEVNIHYKSPIQTLVKGEGHPFNIDDLSKFQKEMMRLHSTSEYDRNYNKESQRKHHFTPNQESIVHLDRYQNAYAQNGSSYSSQLLARVLFNFHALSSREISVRKGDIVIIHRPVNHHWVEVEDSQSGLKGLVPRSYLDYEQEGIAKAKYDFDAKTSVEISFKKGDVLKLIRKVDENWYEGINQKGLMGIFPCTYVETLKTPLCKLINGHLGSSNVSPSSSISTSSSLSSSSSTTETFNFTKII